MSAQPSRPFVSLPSSIGLGWVIALLVLVACLVIALATPAARNVELLLIAALAVARLV